MSSNPQCDRWSRPHLSTQCKGHLPRGAEPASGSVARVSLLSTKTREIKHTFNKSTGYIAECSLRASQPAHCAPINSGSYHYPGKSAGHHIAAETITRWESLVAKVKLAYSTLLYNPDENRARKTGHASQPTDGKNVLIFLPGDLIMSRHGN